MNFQLSCSLYSSCHEFSVSDSYGFLVTLRIRFIVPSLEVWNVLRKRFGGVVVYARGVFECCSFRSIGGFVYFVSV